DLLRPRAAVRRGPLRGFPLFGGPSRVRGELVLRVLESLVEPIEFRLALFDSLGDLVRLDVALLERRGEYLQSVFAVREFVASVLHIRGRLREICELLFEVRFTTREFGLPRAPGLFPCGQTRV